MHAQSLFFFISGDNEAGLIKLFQKESGNVSLR